MDVENHEDTYVENPMCVEIIPVAEVVAIEVISEVLIEQKRNSENSDTNTVTLTFNQKLWFWCNIACSFLFCLAVLSGFVLLLVWLNNPKVFGPVNN
jgi:hypothetical protein